MSRTGDSIHSRHSPQAYIHGCLFDLWILARWPTGVNWWKSRDGYRWAYLDIHTWLAFRILSLEPCFQPMDYSFKRIFFSEIRSKHSFLRLSRCLLGLALPSLALLAALFTPRFSLRTLSLLERLVDRSPFLRYIYKGRRRSPNGNGTGEEPDTISEVAWDWTISYHKWT